MMTLAPSTSATWPSRSSRDRYVKRHVSNHGAGWACDMLLAVCLSQVIVTHYPMEIKAFYMKKVDKPVVVNGEDRYTVEAMDMLVPQVGRKA